MTRAFTLDHPIGFLLFAAGLTELFFETAVGIVTAPVGVPFFLYLARRDQRGM